MRLKITDAGFAKLVNPPNTGTNAVLITEIGLTSTAFTPTTGLTALPGEIKRVTTFGGNAVGDDTLHVTIRDDSATAYSLRGFGLYLGDGTLFATFGQTDPIMEKTAASMLLLSTDTRFSEVDTALIEFGNAEFIYPPSTTEVQGVVELATTTETEDGADTQRAVTPRGLRAFIDKRFGASAPTQFVRTLLSIATDAAFRSALGLKSAALKDEGADKGLDADLLDGRHGNHYLDWRNMTGVPSSVHVPGQVILFAGATAPNGMLLCNGAAVPRASYPALFAAIGTRYGAGDGATTFNLPAMQEGTVVTHTLNPEAVGSFTQGEVIRHAQVQARQQQATTATPFPWAQAARTPTVPAPVPSVTTRTVHGPTRRATIRIPVAPRGPATTSMEALFPPILPSTATASIANATTMRCIRTAPQHPPAVTPIASAPTAQAHMATTSA